MISVGAPSRSKEGTVAAAKAWERPCEASKRRGMARERLDILVGLRDSRQVFIKWSDELTAELRS